MAIIPYTQTSLPEPGNPFVWVVQWGPMQNGDIGAPITDLYSYSDRSMQVEGTFGAGGACTLEGSNDKVNFRTLSDPQGVALVVTTGSIKEVTELALTNRPHITAGDGTTALTVTMILRKTKGI